LNRKMGPWKGYCERSGFVMGSEKKKKVGDLRVSRLGKIKKKGGGGTI